MTDKEKLDRITGLLNELNLTDMSQDDLTEYLKKMSFNDINDLMWKLFCFVEDVWFTLDL